MDRPATLSAALEALDAATVSNADLLRQVEAFTDLANEHQAVVEKSNQLTNLLESEREANLKLVTQVSELNAQLVAFSANAQTLENAANNKATEMLASVGVEFVSLGNESAGAPKSTADLWAEYHALPIEQRNAFYVKNRSLLRP